MKGDTPAKLVIEVLGEARVKFGPFTEANRAQVTAWVKRRVDQVRRGPREHGASDPSAAAGDDPDA